MRLTKRELKELDNICLESSCFNKPIVGYVYCITCLHGCPVQADKELIAIKMKYQKEVLDLINQQGETNDRL